MLSQMGKTAQHYSKIFPWRLNLIMLSKYVQEKLNQNTLTYYEIANYERHQKNR